MPTALEPLALEPLVLALASAGALALCAPALAATPRVGAPAPAVTVRTLDGETLDLTQLRGKVLVVNVWATWCAPCRAEMPMLDAFYRRHRDAGVVMVGLSADRSRDRRDVATVMSTFAYPAGLLSEAKVDKLDEPRVLPLTWVVDATGVVRSVFGGAGTPLTAEALEAAVAPWLCGGRSDPDDRRGPPSGNQTPPPHVCAP
jgi:thiol-disulfide isomerase/thioredoxin